MVGAGADHSGTAVLQALEPLVCMIKYRQGQTIWGMLCCRYVKLHVDGKMASDEYAERPECGSRVMKSTFTSARARGYGYPADLTAEARPDRSSRSTGTPIQ